MYHVSFQGPYEYKHYISKWEVGGKGSEGNIEEEEDKKEMQGKKKQSLWVQRLQQLQAGCCPFPCLSSCQCSPDVMV